MATKSETSRNKSLATDKARSKVASPPNEQGAEDESSTDANLSRDKSAPAKKAQKRKR
jgi:hypothetical protein